MIIVNGKEYPLWNQFVILKTKWIGGEMQDKGDSMDRAFGFTDGRWHTTRIVDVELLPNGEDSAFFSVKGKNFNCGFDVKVGGLIGGEEGWITFRGYGGHVWRIRPNEHPTRNN